MRKKVPLSVLGIVASLGLIWLAWDYSSRSGAEDVAGLYLVNGGRSYLLIESRPFRRLEVTAGDIVMVARAVHQPSETLSFAAFRNGRLNLHHQSFMYLDMEGYEDLPAVATLRASFVPSKTESEDWDCISARFEYWGNPRKFYWPTESKLTYRYYRLLWDEIKRHYAGEDPSLVLAGTLTASADVDTDDAPIPSMLHRCDHPEMAEMFEKRAAQTWSEEDTIRFLPLLRSLPEDPYLLLHIFDLEVESGESDRAAKGMRAWKDRYSNHPDKDLHEAARIVEDHIWAATTGQEEKDLRLALEPLHGETESLEARFDRMIRYLDWERIPPIPENLIFPDRGLRWEDDSLQLGILGLQKITWFATTQAYLTCFEGKIDEALDLCLGRLQLSACVLRSDYFSGHLVGVSIGRFALSSDAKLLANVDLTESQLVRYREGLLQIRDAMNVLNAQRLVYGEYPLGLICHAVQHLNVWFSTSLSSKIQEGFQALLASLECQIAATWVKQYLLEHQTLPSSIAEVEQAFDIDLPNDLVSTNPFEFRVVNENQVHIRPVQGTIHFGVDLFLHPPSPIPPDGIHANTAQDVLDQFPNGLPVDPMHGEEVPLTVFEFGESDPVRIVSFAEAPEQITDFTAVSAYRVPGNELLPDVPRPASGIQYAIRIKDGTASKWIADSTRMALKLSPLPPAMTAPFPPFMAAPIPNSPTETMGSEVMENVRQGVGDWTGVDHFQEMFEKVESGEISPEVASEELFESQMASMNEMYEAYLSGTYQPPQASPPQSLTTLAPYYNPTNGVHSDGFLWVELKKKE